MSRFTPCSVKWGQREEEENRDLALGRRLPTCAGHHC